MKPVDTSIQGINFSKGEKCFSCYEKAVGVFSYITLRFVGLYVAKFRDLRQEANKRVKKIFCITCHINSQGHQP